MTAVGSTPRKALLWSQTQPRKRVTAQLDDGDLVIAFTGFEPRQPFEPRRIFRIAKWWLPKFAKQQGLSTQDLIGGLHAAVDSFESGDQLRLQLWQTPWAQTWRREQIERERIDSELAACVPAYPRHHPSLRSRQRILRRELQRSFDAPTGNRSYLSQVSESAGLLRQVRLVVGTGYSGRC